MTKCTIRQASLDEIDRIRSFLNLAYGYTGEHSMPDRWAWEYLRNPYRGNKNADLPIWIAEENNSIVGQICTIPIELRIGSLTLHAVWGVDLIVLPSFRGGGIGRQLIEKVVQDNQCYMAIDMSDITKRIYDRLGYIQIPPVPVYRKIVQLSSSLVSEYLARSSKKNAWIKQLNLIIPRRLLSRFLAFSINRIIRVRKALSLQAKKKKKKNQVDIFPLQSFGPGMDEFWKKIQSQYGIIVKRDQTFLNWRFRGNRDLNYLVFGARREGDISGYIVLRKGELNQTCLGYVVDILSARDDEETIDALVRYAIDFFGDEVEAIEFACTPSEYQHILKRYGFFKMKESIPYSWCVDEQTRKQMEELKGEWFITRGDSDWDFGVS